MNAPLKFDIENNRCEWENAGWTSVRKLSDIYFFLVFGFFGRDWTISPGINVWNSLTWSCRKPQSNTQPVNRASQVESEALPTAALDCFQGNRRLDWLINESCQKLGGLWLRREGAEPFVMYGFSQSRCQKKHWSLNKNNHRLRPEVGKLTPNEIEAPKFFTVGLRGRQKVWRQACFNLLEKFRKFRSATRTFLDFHRDLPR